MKSLDKDRVEFEVCKKTDESDLVFDRAPTQKLQDGLSKVGKSRKKLKEELKKTEGLLDT